MPSQVFDIHAVVPMNGYATTSGNEADDFVTRNGSAAARQFYKDVIATFDFNALSASAHMGADRGWDIMFKLNAGTLFLGAKRG